MAVPDHATKVFVGPGENYETVGVLQSGQSVEVVGVSPDAAWWALRMTSTDDGLGWIPAGSARMENAHSIGAMQGTILPGSNAAPGVPHLTALVNVEIQAGPGSQYETLGYLESGQRAEVVGISADGQWWVIKMPYFESGHGWVAEGKVETENTDEVTVVTLDDSPGSVQLPEQANPTVTAIANVNVRSGPGMGYKIIGLLKYGQTVEAIGIDPDRFWLAIKTPGTDDQQGWISVDYIAPDELGDLAGLPVLEPRPVGGASIVPLPTPGKPMMTTLYVVNIRSGPSTQYDILGKLVQGQQAEVVGVSADGLWWIIRIDGVNNGQGWVAAAYVKAENTTGVPIVK